MYKNWGNMYKKWENVGKSSGKKIRKRPEGSGGCYGHKAVGPVELVMRTRAAELLGRGYGNHAHRRNATRCPRYFPRPVSRT